MRLPRTPGGNVHEQVRHRSDHSCIGCRSRRISRLEIQGESAIERGDAINLVGRINLASAPPEQLVSLIKEHHDEAFSQSYDIGGLTGQATHDESAYYSALFELMVEQAQSEGSAALADELHRHSVVYSR